MTAAYQPDDERAAELLRAIFGGGALVCLARCEPCQWGQHPGGEHPWAGPEDLAHAAATGQSADGVCGCDCTREAAVEETDEPAVEFVPIDGPPPCHLCGADGACGYDDEGRPYIHASWDEDDTEEVR